MAKEAGKPKVKKKGKSKRPTFCPNSSKSFNLSLSRSKNYYEASSELRKNNTDLAKSLNLHKTALANLERERRAQDAEIMELRIENAQLRAGPDPQDVEAEVQRRVKEHLSQINNEIKTAIDHSIGLSTILTQLCVSTSRASMATSGAGVPRNSDIGGSRMRQVINTRAPGSGSAWSKGSGSGSSPPKQLSKVSPMVAGHAISRPRIQLPRMDLSSITVQDQEEDNTAVDDIEPINEDIIVHARIEENLDDPEEIAATPTLPAPTRNVFNLTNIREESTLLEDSVMVDAMEETLLTPRDEMEAVQEENAEDLENILEPNVSNNRRSVRQSLQPPRRLSQSNSFPSTSPYVLDVDKTPVGLPREDLSRPTTSTVARPTSPNLANTSASLTESFLEQMVGIDPMEGPSWLFASVKKKKRRSSAVRKLSCIMSDLDNTASSSLDGSQSEESRPSSNFVLDPDLRESMLPETVGNIVQNILDDDDESNQENVPLETYPNSGRVGSRLSSSSSSRTPLSSLETCVDDRGNQVNLKEARIMLNNVGVDSIDNVVDSVSPAPRLKKMTLDDLFSNGVRSDYTEVTFKRKFGSDSQVADSSKTKKKPRTTEVTSNVKLQNLEVRLENLASPVVESPQSNVETNNDQQIEGRSRRRNKSQVSYKEPGLGKKLRQGDATSSSIYNDYKPEVKEVKKKNAKKKTGK